MAEEIEQFPFVGIVGFNSVFNGLNHCEDNRYWRTMLGMTDEKFLKTPYTFDECRNAFFMPQEELKAQRIIEGLPSRADFA